MCSCLFKQEDGRATEPLQGMTRRTGLKYPFGKNKNKTKQHKKNKTQKTNLISKSNYLLSEAKCFVFQVFP